MLRVTCVLVLAVACTVVAAGAAAGAGTVIVTTLKPAVVGQGGSKTIAITGTGFTTGATAAVSGTGIVVKRTTFLGPSLVRAVLSVSGTAALGTRDVTVTAGGSSGTCINCLTITPAPRILGLTRTGVSPGEVVRFTAIGENFQRNVKITTPNRVAFKVVYVSPVELTVTATVSAAATLGTRNLTVRNPDAGKSGCASCLSVLAPVTVGSVAPQTLSRGATSTITLGGTEFVAGAAVQVTGPGVTVGPVTVESQSSLTVEIAAAEDAPPVARFITVVNPDGRTGSALIGVSDVALVYGDSLTWESTPSLNLQVAAQQPAWSMQVHSLPTTAPCVWREWLTQDLDTYRPRIVALTSAGNGYSPLAECMVDATGAPIAIGTPEFLAKTREDLTAIFAAVSSRGIPMVFNISPPMLDPARNAAVAQTGVIATELAAQYPGVSISPYVRDALSVNGAYAESMPCLATETLELGCVNGTIPVRTTIGIQRGLHLCPIGLPDFPWFCTVYSSGETRFADAVLRSVLLPPPPISG